MKIKGRIITAAILMQLVFIAFPVEAMTNNNRALTSGRNSSSKNGLEQIHSGDLLQQEDTETPEPTETPSSSNFSRPVVVVKSYYTEPGAVQAGGEFTLYITLINKGQTNAKNLVLTFSAANFSPLDTGGVITFGTLKAGEKKTVHQSFYAAPGLWGYSVEPLSLSVGYTDVDNYSFSETFNTSISLEPATYIEPTATPTVSVSRPRLLVTQSSTDLDILQPGSQFQLFLEITNVGSETARGVNLVVGGAAVEPVSSTDTPGGSYSATGGDFTNFSPMGGSNVQALGDIAIGATFTASQPLIVNVSTNPGVYTLKISLVYANGKGETLSDDMVITLMVKSIPMIDISFYQEPSDLFTFQPNALPLQIVNIGKKSITLGNMKITSSNGSVENGSLQIGYLDSGGYLTQDALLIPDMPGEVTITVTVNYIDDFNQPQIITQDLIVNVVDMPVMDIPEDMGMNETINPPIQETFWQKVWRFIKGIFGFDSSTTDQNQTIPFEEGGLDSSGDISVPIPVKGP